MIHWKVDIDSKNIGIVYVCVLIFIISYNQNKLQKVWIYQTMHRDTVYVVFIRNIHVDELNVIHYFLFVY